MGLKTHLWYSLVGKLKHKRNERAYITTRPLNLSRFLAKIDNSHLFPGGGGGGGGFPLRKSSFQNFSGTFPMTHFLNDGKEPVS